MYTEHKASTAGMTLNVWQVASINAVSSQLHEIIGSFRKVLKSYCLVTSTRL